MYFLSALPFHMLGANFHIPVEFIQLTEKRNNTVQYQSKTIKTIVG